MAHNAYIRALGTWAALSDLLNTEMEAFDLRQFQAVNGDLGGTWTPSAALIIGGASGLHVTGPFVADDADVTIGHGRFLTVLGTSGGALATMNANSGSVVNLGGTTNVTATGRMHVLTGGGKITVDSGGAFEVFGATALTFKAGSTSLQEDTATFDLRGQTDIRHNVTLRGPLSFPASDGSIVGESGTTIGLVAGAFLTVQGTNTLTGTNVIGDAVGGHTTTMNGEIDLSSNAVVTADVATVVNLPNITHLTGTLQVETSGTVLLTSSGVLTTQSGATVTRGATETRTARVILSGGSALTELRTANSPAATGAAFDPSAQDIWVVPPGLAADVTYTLSPPAHPCTYTFTRIATSGLHDVTINRASDGQQLCVLNASLPRWVDIYYDGVEMNTIRGGTLTALT